MGLEADLSLSLPTIPVHDPTTMTKVKSLQKFVDVIADPVSILIVANRKLLTGHPSL